MKKIAIFDEEIKGIDKYLSFSFDEKYSVNREILGCEKKDLSKEDFLDFLIGFKNKSIYLFTNDKGITSTICYLHKNYGNITVLTNDDKFEFQKAIIISN